MAFQNIDVEDIVRSTLAFLAAVALCLSVVAGIYIYNNKQIKMADKGYCETQGYGTSSILWQKCK